MKGWQAFVVGFLLTGFGIVAGRSYEQQRGHTYTVEHFTPDLTIRIQCSGDCDLAAMIAEAREAVEK